MTVSVYGLGQLDPALGANLDNIDPAEIDAHAVLSQLRDALLTIDTSVPEALVGGRGLAAVHAGRVPPLRPRRHRRADRGRDLPGVVREWPPRRRPGRLRRGGRRLRRRDALRRRGGRGRGAWFAELSASTQQTIWTSDGETDRFTVLPRPLLPGDQPTCDLGDRLRLTRGAAPDGAAPTPFATMRVVSPVSPPVRACLTREADAPSEC